MDKEYIQLSELISLLKKRFPDVIILEMPFMVVVDSASNELYHTTTLTVGTRDDTENEIIQSVFNKLEEEISTTGHKKLGIFGLFTLKSVWLRYAFPQKIDDVNKIEEPYEPKFTKSVKPFPFDGDLIDRIKE